MLATRLLTNWQEQPWPKTANEVGFYFDSGDFSVLFNGLQKLHGNFLHLTIGSDAVPGVARLYQVGNNNVGAVKYGAASFAQINAAGHGY